MNTMFWKMYVKLQGLMHTEEGQDLVEYALLVALIALGAIAAIGGVGKAITSVFTTITSSLTSAVTGAGGQ